MFPLSCTDVLAEIDEETADDGVGTEGVEIIVEVPDTGR